MENHWTNQEDLEHWFYEIDLSLEEKLEILPKLKISTPIADNGERYTWNKIFNIDGVVYRVYGTIADFWFNEHQLIVRLEPHDRHSDR